MKDPAPRCAYLRRSTVTVTLMLLMACMSMPHITAAAGRASTTSNPFTEQTSFRVSRDRVEAARQGMN